MRPHDGGLARPAGPAEGGPRPGSVRRDRRALLRGGAFRLMLALLAALMAGGGLGYLVARVLPGPPAGPNAGGPGALSGAGYDRGYHRGWREGYDRGYADASWDQPSLPTHALTFDEARAASAREASAREALAEATRIAGSYRPSGQYQADVYDCNDMAEELWQACSDAGITAFLVAGSTGVEHESFADCDHCWVVIFCTGSTGEEVALAVDPQASLMGVIGPEGDEDEATATVSAQYAEGYFYCDPAALRLDLGRRW